MLKSNTVEALKIWDMQYPTIIYDRKYLKELAKDVFGLECLAKSSVGGTPSRNVKKQHAPLNPTKLKFMRGKYLILIFTFCQIGNLCTSATDIFTYRTGGDISRSGRFTEIMNKHCNNAKKFRFDHGESAPSTK